MEYTKKEAINIANEFIAEINKLQEKYNMTLDSDSRDLYLSFKSKETDKYWDYISLGSNENENIKIIK